MKDRKKSGFTLIELIVVLVILAVLAAILIPALLGWIDKAKEKKYLLEARNVVLASQAAATEAYAATTTEFNITGSAFINKYEADILSTADANGTLSALAFVKPETNKQLAVIQSLTYIAENGTKITYDIDTNPVYQIDKDSESSVKPGAPTCAKNWPAIIEEYYKNTGMASSSKLETAVGNLPSLTADENQMLHPDIEGIINAGDTSNLAWCPRQVDSAVNLDGTTGYILAACPNTGNQNINAQLLYYEGSYYVCLNKVYNGIKLDNSSIHQSFDVSVLDKAPTLSNIDLNSITGKTWVKYDIK